MVIYLDGLKDRLEFYPYQSIARCLKSLIRSASILVENTFLFVIIGILYLYRVNYNKDNKNRIIKEIKN